MKKTLTLLLALCILLSMMVGCAGKPAAPAAPAEGGPAKLMAEPMTFKVGYPENPDTALGRIMPKAFETITEKTNGELKFEIFPSGSLGEIPEVVEQIAAGAPMISTAGYRSSCTSGLSDLAVHGRRSCPLFWHY